jgi:hypothetical protein
MSEKSLSPEMLEMLRCPVGVHATDKGDDPGKLTLVKDTWLVCEDNGYKYPHPVMVFLSCWWKKAKSGKIRLWMICLCHHRPLNKLTDCVTH